MTIKSFKSKWIVGLLGLVMASLTYATEYTSIDASKSSISFTSKLMGSNLHGSFNKFGGKVSFNPEAPEQGKADLWIDMNSFDAGGEELRQEAKGKDWFDIKVFPKAHFVINTIKNIGKGQLELHGVLTIKNKTLPLVLWANYQVQTKQVIFDASFQILRLSYMLGTGAWSDVSAVPNEVPVKVHFVLNPK